MKFISKSQSHLYIIKIYFAFLKINSFQPADLALTHFSKAIEDIIAIYRVNKHRLFTLLQKLKVMEKCRSEDFKRILKVAYKKMNEISFKLPFEIQEYFEQEIEVKYSGVFYLLFLS